ncbi:MAG: LPS export ABC transporter periplasmic protein LptC [Pseudomonadota bacterium]
MTTDQHVPSIAAVPPRGGASASQGQRGRLDNLPTGRRLTGAQAQLRSRNVRILRYVLPGLAVILLVIFFVASQNKPEDNTRLEDLALDEVMPEAGAMTNPTFAGIDADGQPYKITAATAIQDRESDKVVNLDRPSATLSDGSTGTLATANRGQFKSEEKLLSLEDDVTLERVINGRTYVLRSPAAIVSIDGETVTSESGVTGQSDRGKLRADRVEIFNDERRVVFRGNVLMKFEPKAPRTPAAPTTGN